MRLWSVLPGTLHIFILKNFAGIPIKQKAPQGCAAYGEEHGLLKQGNKFLCGRSQ